jgi:hypothetical protein
MQSFVQKLMAMTSDHLEKKVEFLVQSETDMDSLIDKLDEIETRSWA